MKNILENNFNKELIVYAVRPDLGHMELNCRTIKKCIELEKRVLFYSLEQSEDTILKRIGLNDTKNLLIKDKLVENIEDIELTINSFKPDIVIIDYFMLLTRDIKQEDICILNRIANKYDIPFVVVYHISEISNKEVDFTTITLDEFKKINLKSIPIIEESDRFIVFYQKGTKEYILKELKNIYNETKEVDIRKLLN